MIIIIIYSIKPKHLYTIKNININDYYFYINIIKYFLLFLPVTINLCLNSHQTIPIKKIFSLKSWNKNILIVIFLYLFCLSVFSLLKLYWFLFSGLIYVFIIFHNFIWWEILMGNKILMGNFDGKWKNKKKLICRNFMSWKDSHKHLSFLFITFIKYISIMFW